MLDWMSHEYNVLFVVSAGNHVGSDLPMDLSIAELATLTRLRKQEVVLRAYVNDFRSRPLLAARLARLTISASREPDSLQCESHSTSTRRSSATARVFHLSRACLGIGGCWSTTSHFAREPVSWFGNSKVEVGKSGSTPPPIVALMRSAGGCDVTEFK